MYIPDGVVLLLVVTEWRVWFEMNWVNISSAALG